MSEDFTKRNWMQKWVVSKMEITTPHGALEGKTQTREVRFCK